MDNPMGRTAWAFNSLTGGITVRNAVDTADGEKAPCDDFQKDIDSAVLLEGVVSFCCRAFGCCSKLKSVHIPKSITTIGDEVFACCEVGNNHNP